MQVADKVFMESNTGKAVREMLNYDPEFDV